jgi:peptidoglycan/LPS O-acetylase OafA/YrhL
MIRSGRAGPGRLVVGVAGAVVIAAASYYALERPLLRLKRLVPDPQAPPRDPTTHAAMQPAAPPAR